MAACSTCGTPLDPEGWCHVCYWIAATHRRNRTGINNLPEDERERRVQGEAARVRAWLYRECETRDLFGELELTEGIG